MPITIGSNISSLSAQRRLSENTSQLSKTYERLSSGLRINRAADDAAGLAISESLRSDKRVFNQGIRNFNDGVSLLNIADGAIENLSNIVVRLKELAEQSANGTYSTTQRNAIDKEAQALSKEYTRIVHSTKFNGVHLLDGGLGNGLRLQGGYGSDGGVFSGIGGDIGTGSFTAFVTVSANNPLSVSSGDYNGDGILDLATIDYSAIGVLSVRLGTGSGTFGNSVTTSTGGFPLFITSLDTNNDGVLDLVTTSGSNSTVAVLLGNGNGTFQQERTSLAGASPTYISGGDFNNDGIMDLVTSNSGSDTISVLQGKGDGTFTSPTNYGTGTVPRSVLNGDFNGDGNLDIISMDTVAGAISLFLGNGNGTFAARTSVTGLGIIYSGSTADLNNDGKLDLLTVDSTFNAVSVNLGNGDGTFGARVSYSVGTSPRSVASGDFNGDGILDIVTGDRNSATVSVLLGIGDGTLSQRTSFAVGAQTNQVLTDDYNGDGVYDILTADTSSDNLSLLFGHTRDGASPLIAFDLKTSAGARQALPVFDQKIQQLAKQRGQIGAFQSRVQVGINNLLSASENYSAAESRIRDADIAHESSQLLRLNILQQAASSVLGQANLQPALTLKLLGGA